MWEYNIDFDREWLYYITSNRFIVQLTGGSIIILDRQTQKQLQRDKGYTNLYTGDISPDEKLCFALENGRHFYVYSLENFERIKRVSLPSGYECIDMYGHFTEDGKYICIPGEKWIPKQGACGGRSEYTLFHYDVNSLSLVKKTAIVDNDDYRWTIDGSKPIPDKESEREVEELVNWIMSLGS